MGLDGALGDLTSINPRCPGEQMICPFAKRILSIDHPLRTTVVQEYTKANYASQLGSKPSKVLTSGGRDLGR